MNNDKLKTMLIKVVQNHQETISVLREQLNLIRDTIEIQISPIKEMISMHQEEIIKMGSVFAQGIEQAANDMDLSI